MIMLKKTANDQSDSRNIIYAYMWLFKKEKKRLVKHSLIKKNEYLLSYYCIKYITRMWCIKGYDMFICTCVYLEI